MDNNNFNAKLISAIVPIYGTEAYVGKCLYSILAQTYSNIEILAVNDGSIDNSKYVILDAASDDCIQKKFLKSEKEIENIEFNLNSSSDEFETTPKTIEIFYKDHDITRLHFYLCIETEKFSSNYFRRIYDLAQELLYNNSFYTITSDYLIDDFGNVSRIKIEHNINIFDTVVIQVQDKSYCISSSLSRIRYIEHFENQGLFQARLTGYEYALGEFITSIDSDDYLGIDYLRLLYKREIDTDADVVIGEMVRENIKTKFKGKRTHSMYAIRGLNLYDESITDNLFDCEGELSPLWFVWGKLYKKSLWDKCYSDLMQVQGHHIMLEDMLYGTVFSINAHHYVYCDADTYFYVVNETASTANNGTPEKLYKNLNDVFYAFNFIEEYLKTNGVYEKYESKFNKFKKKWSRTWYQIENNYLLADEERDSIMTKLEALAPDGELEMPTNRDIFFYRTCTPWDSRIESLKSKIKKKDVISFDIFDTLVVRPFFKPLDMFVLLDNKFKELCPDCGILFSDMRVAAEKQARNNLIVSASQFEDITIDEIYTELQVIFGISSEQSMIMLDEELRLEKEMCQPRQKIKELYDLALWLGKRVVFVSDMYLPLNTIIDILENCGYRYDNNLYLSSDYRLSKTTGHLYEKMLDMEEVEASSCLHIGDNWASDGEAAQKLGIEPWRTPKTIDLLLNNVADINKTKVRAEFGELLYRNLTGSFIRYSQALDYFGIRCMLAIIANKIFDNPYSDWEPHTDFNRNPYNIGYMALGMHEYGIVHWLIGKVPKNHKIFFVARDGYLAMKVYAVIKKFFVNIPDADYFYMSRKSFLPLSISNESDWWTMKENINYKGKTPQQLLAYYSPILPDYGENTYITYLRRQGLLYDMPLENEEQYRLFVKTIQTEFHDQNLIDSYRSKMKKHLTKIFSPGDVMFDIGYSGRAQAILSKLLGFGIDAYYIHTLSEKSNIFEKNNNFHVHTFFDYSPALTGKIRELIQSEPIPSCVGYEIDNNSLIPVFEEKEWAFHERYVINQMHKGAIDFVSDFLNIFCKYTDRMYFRNSDISFIHEKFILMPKKPDMEIFELFHFEDDLFFNKDYEEKWLTDIWSGDLKWNHLPSYEFKRNTSSNPTPRKPVATVTAEKQKSEAKTNSGYKYVPYSLEPDPPKGLIKKIKYFKNNDHIILKKYMHSKGKNTEIIFNRTYNTALKLKHALKRQNRVGNSLLDYTLNKNGNILYNATSAYGLLCCIVHKLTFHPQEKADLMLSSWRKDKYDSVVKTDFFNKIFLWSDMKYRDTSYAMDHIMKNANDLEKLEQEYRFFGIYEKLIPVKINEYKEIIIAGNSMPFGDFLERNEVAYSIIEDGAGLYSDYSLLQHSIDETYPLIEQYMIKKYKNLQGGDHCQKIYINYSAQKRSYDNSKTADFRPVALIDSLNSNQRRKIFNIYGVTESQTENTKRTCLFLTYPLAQREKFTLYEEKMCYTLLADIFGNDCEEIHIKAHPDDRTDFSNIEGLTIINRNVLSELLWYETKTQYVKAFATVSTSMNNLLCIDQGTSFDATFCKEYKNLLRYYVISKVIGEDYKSNQECRVAGVEIYHDMMKTLLEESQGHFNYMNDEETDDTYHYLVAMNEKQINNEGLYTKIVLLDAPKNTENYRHILIRKKKVKNYDFINLVTEDFYISNNFEIVFPLLLDMEITGIKLQVCEDYLIKRDIDSEN